MYTHIHVYMYIHTSYRSLKNSSGVQVRYICVTAVFCNYFNFPLVVLLRAARKSRGDITAEETPSYTCLAHVRLCVCARAMHGTLFGRIRRLLDISRFPFLSYAPFPFLLLLPRCSSQARRAHACVHACMCVCVCAGQKRCARLVAVPCRCMQILSPNLVSARASVLRTKATGG